MAEERRSQSVRMLCPKYLRWSRTNLLECIQFLHA